MIWDSVISHLQSRAVFILSEGSLLGLWSVLSKSAGPFGELATYKHHENLVFVQIQSQKFIAHFGKYHVLA